MTQWTPFQRIPQADVMAKALSHLPPHWSLTPLWEKRPYREGWQKEDFIPHSDISRLLQQGEKRISKRTGKTYRAFCSGYGLRLGEVSGGLLAIDVDGSSAEDLLSAFATTSLPETVAWTSGKPGRRQLLYQIPDSYREKLNSFRRYTLTEWQGLTTTTGELLEFRYNQHQSALPPSFHSQTGQYRWLKSPQEIEVAIAPQWLCQFLLTSFSSPPHSRIREFSSGNKEITPLNALLEEATNRLRVEEIYHWSGHQFQDWGETWRGYCPRHQSQSGSAFTLNPHSKQWYCFGCEVGGGAVQYRHFLQGGNGTPRGKVFHSLVQELATEAGLKTTSYPPSPEPQTYRPTHIISQEYFHWETPTEETIIAVKSSLGSGKTQWLGKVISDLKEEGWLALGHRNSLLLQSCQRWGLVHLQTEQAFDLIKVPNSQLALCVDSLHHFPPEAFAGKNIIIDEAIAVVTHLLMGETLKQKREAIIQQFSLALKQAKRVFCLDAMLSDWCVNYLHALAGKERPLIKIENRHQGHPFQIKLLQDTQQRKGKQKYSDRASLLEPLWLSAKPVICTDSQLEAEALDQLLSEKGNFGLRIDSKTIASSSIQTFLKHPDNYIKTYLPDYLIYTPAAEAGVDISIRDYFTDQFCLFFGVIPTRAQLQMMARIRDPKLNRWLWCYRYGQVKNPSANFQFPNALLQAMESLILQTGTTLLQGKETTTVVEKFIHQVTTATNDTHYQTFCILQAIQSYEQSHLWECLYNALIKNGHHLELINLETSPVAKQQEKRAKEAVKLSNAEAIYSGHSQQGNRLTTTHKLLRKQLPGIESTSVWSPRFIKRVVYDDRTFISKQERFWLIHHPEITQQLKWLVLSSGIEANSLPENQPQWSMIQGLITLNLPPLLNLKKTWTKDEPELQQLQRTVNQHSLRFALHLKPYPQPPIALFRQVLSLIGVKLTHKNGQYQINSTAWRDRDRLTILHCLERRYQIIFSSCCQP